MAAADERRQTGSAPCRRIEETMGMTRDDDDAETRGEESDWRRRKDRCRAVAPSLMERVAIILRHGGPVLEGACEVAAETLFEDLQGDDAGFTEAEKGRVLGALAKLALGTHEEPAALHHTGEVSGLDRPFGAVVYGLGILHGPADNLILMHDGLRRIDEGFARTVLEELVRHDPDPDVARRAGGLLTRWHAEIGGAGSILSTGERRWLERVWPVVRTALSPGRENATVAESLSREPPTYSIATLIVLAQSPDRPVRTAALESLAGIDPDSARIMEDVSPTFASRHFV